MEKISSIIPSNERIESVNMRKASPVRSGVPAFGREVVQASNHRALPKTTLSEASFTYDLMNHGKERLKAQAEKVDQLADRFFMDRVADKPAVKPGDVEVAKPQDPIAQPAPVSAPAVAVSEDGLQTNGQNLAVIA